MMKNSKYAHNISKFVFNRLCWIGKNPLDFETIKCFGNEFVMLLLFNNKFRLLTLSF